MHTLSFFHFSLVHCLCRKLSLDNPPLIRVSVRGMNESSVCKYCEQRFDLTPQHAALGISEFYCCTACHDAVEMPESNNGKPLFVSLESIANTVPDLPPIADGHEIDEDVKRCFGYFIMYRRIFRKLSAVEQTFVDWFFDHPREPMQNFATARGVSREAARQVMDSVRIKWPAFAECWPKKNMRRG